MQPRAETELQAGLQQGVQRVQGPARSHRQCDAAVHGAGHAAQAAAPRISQIQGENINNGWRPTSSREERE